MTLLACFLAAGFALNYVLSHRQLQGLSVRRLLTEPSFRVTPWTYSLEITNRGKHLLHSLRIQHGTESWTIATLAVGESAVVHGSQTFPKRGPIELEPIGVLSRYPFGLTEIARPALPSETVLVLPRVAALPTDALRSYLRSQSLAESRSSATRARSATAQQFFHGLRIYRPGDSLRSIHWRSSARRGELMVREFDDPPSDNLTVVLDAAGVRDADDWEQRVTAAATICWERCRQTGDRLVLAVTGCDLQVVAGSTGRGLAYLMLEALAVAEAGPDEDDQAVVERLQAEGALTNPILVLAAPGSRLTASLRDAAYAPVLPVPVRWDDAGNLFLH